MSKHPQKIQKTATGTEKSIKIRSERTNKRRYVPKYPNYFKTKYNEYTHAKTCPICGSVINTQMHRHNRSRKSQLVRAGVANTVDHIESAIASVIQEAS
jgi:hypothetical protein